MDGAESFEFDNQAANISAFARQLLLSLEAMLNKHNKARAVMLRAKFIIAELLNNAVKHSGVEKTHFTIKVEPTCVSISKKDKGSPFNLYEKMKQPHQQYMVSADAMHLLYAVVKEKAVHFYCKENFTIQANVNELHEHMGLLIITKAADEFTYRYEQPENVFCARLNLS